jgi:hypothetical protein
LEKHHLLANMQLKALQGGVGGVAMGFTDLGQQKTDRFFNHVRTNHLVG